MNKYLELKEKHQKGSTMKKEIYKIPDIGMKRDIVKESRVIIIKRNLGGNIN